MQRLKILLILTLVSCAASGCGQRGPLYLPEKEVPVSETTVVPDAEQGDSEKKEDKGNAQDT